jgi:hypothetical protein
MANPSRAKGTDFEVSLLELLTTYYPEARRNPLSGSKDVGDFHLPGEKRFILEAKNRTVLALPAWLKQARDAAMRHFPTAVGVVVHKRKGTRLASDQYVTMTFSDFLWLVNHG